MRLLWALAAICCLTGTALTAQDVPQGNAQGGPQDSPQGEATDPASAAGSVRNGKLIFPVLVFDRARVLSQSQAGQDLEARAEAERSALLAENDKIYADLEAEEQAIADMRDSLSDEDFKARAQAFDAKVTEVRAEQDAKGKELQTFYDTRLAQLEQDMNGVLTGIARDYGAVLMFERGQVYLMSGAIDVSAIAIDRLDARDDDEAAAEDTTESTVEDTVEDSGGPKEANPAQE
ncbi:OmpH family outer membrane protein [Celeribacter neptunius]|uniref:Periplasmic chaperone for outer membrane proteins Skp n=1 Tax=Celeribacter neptunius TaxID=588602 RepID=A0A1I3KUY4_9RHOB|nr:OmpH family outer membrane protein [Celeribacter neptunius]SFI76302.1 periplasmic chaperone for outer membrane proteins Skp [Celeribacter neptunius]